MALRVSCYVGVVAACCALPALAQTDQIGLSHTAAANQLGVLEYCQSQGSVGPESVEAERSSIARLPASSVNTTAAESLGKTGTISVNGTTMTLASIASGRNTTVAAVCKQMGDAAIQTAAAFKSNGASMGMPGGMPAMPAIPQMPANMGAMPTMPSMPGAPPAR